MELFDSLSWLPFSYRKVKKALHSFLYWGDWGKTPLTNRKFAHLPHLDPTTPTPTSRLPPSNFYPPLKVNSPTK